MNLLKLAAKAGGGLLKSFIPGIGAIESVLGAVNEFLPDDKKLNDSATGLDLDRAIESLPQDKQAELLSKKLDVEIVESNNFAAIQASLAEADASGASTRPRIGIAFAYLICITSYFFLGIIGYVVWDQRKTLDISDLSTLWPILAAILGPPMSWLMHYAGKRTIEKLSRYNASVGKESPMSMISSAIGAFKK